MSVLGLENWGVLVTLNASSLNSNPMPSRIEKRRKAAASDRVITREIKGVEIARGIVRPCVRAEGEVLGVGVRRLEKQAAGEPAVQFHLKRMVVRRSGLEQESSASCAR